MIRDRAKRVAWAAWRNVGNLVQWNLMQNQLRYTSYEWETSAIPGYDRQAGRQASITAEAHTQTHPNT